MKEVPIPFVNRKGGKSKLTKNEILGMVRSLFASKDQTNPEMREYNPKLVFTYIQPETKSLDTIIIVALGLTVTVAIAFLAYKFSKRHTRKTRHHKARSKSHLRGDKE